MNGTQVVVVTGASSGVGRAVAHAFAKEGARLALIARNEMALNKTKEEVESLGGSAWVFPLDVSDPLKIEAAASEIERVIGPIDVWVNNAMVSIMGPLVTITPEEFSRITQVTYLGYVWGTQAALKRMCPRNKGVIVQVGSALAHRSIPLQSAYCGAKHAIEGFTESVRCELIHSKSRVKVSMVQLPGVNTPQFRWVRNKMPFKSRPVGKIYQPEVAAQAVVWASKHPRKEILVGTPTLESVFGQRFLPSLLDHYVAKKVYEGHFTREPEDKHRRDNLFSPVGVDYGSHGPFDEISIPNSLQFSLSRHRYLAAFAILLILFIGVLGAFRV